MKRTLYAALAAATLLIAALAGALPAAPDIALPALSSAYVPDGDEQPAPNGATVKENLFSIEALTAPSQGGAPEATTAPSALPEPSASPASGFDITVLTPVATAPKKRVLIYHTHTYEAYEQNPEAPYEETERWRTADERYNMVRLGRELAALLSAQGIEAVHDATAFEPPELAGAYARSLDMLASRLAAGERYDMLIDLHRDAYAESQSGANTVNVSGTEVARLMLLIGKGEGQTSEGFTEKPDWERNLALAQAVTDALNSQANGLCKSVRLKSGRFNQHVSVGCLLVEAGNNRNTLSEALAAMPYLADALADALAAN